MLSQPFRLERQHRVCRLKACDNIAQGKTLGVRGRRAPATAKRTTEGRTMSTVQPVTVGPYTVGGGRPLLWICGPCVIEGHDFTLRLAETLRGIADTLRLPLV